MTITVDDTNRIVRRSGIKDNDIETSPDHAVQAASNATLLVSGENGNTDGMRAVLVAGAQGREWGKEPIYPWNSMHHVAQREPLGSNVAADLMS